MKIVMKRTNIEQCRSTKSIKLLYVIIGSFFLVFFSRQITVKVQTVN